MTDRNKTSAPDFEPDRAARAADAPAAEDDRTAEPIEEREAFPGWPPRDFLQPFVLLAVSLQRAHGYAIEDYLRGFGLFGITMSTLYRTLRQMENTGNGDAWLATSAAMLDAYRETINKFFGLYDAGPGAKRRPPDEPTGQKEAAE
jgi:hypothetical protein